MPGAETACGASFVDTLKSYSQYPLKAGRVEILQLNVGRRCNLACGHCHLEAGPGRTEAMPRAVFQACLDAVQVDPAVHTLDLTGGSPEMNPDLGWFLRAAAGLGRRLLVRTNLVILTEAPYEKFLDLYAETGVEVVGSLPDFHAPKFERQRGEGNFSKAIRALRDLNQRGYGRPGSGRVLHLMHNPAGAYAPAAQAALEPVYRERLALEFGVVFNNLFCLTNMPLGRYRDFLEKSGNYAEYVGSLCKNFNAANLGQVMCKNTLSVGWDGRLYDCDFNQSLDLGLQPPLPGRMGPGVLDALKNREIIVRDHCYGCTAGAGSSCQGCFQ
jgi:radical SAM/Cys-rich protein